MTLRGFDISSHEQQTPPVAPYDYAMLRATYGTTPDTRYQHHFQECRVGALPIIAWHFGRDLPVPAQVNAFLAAAGEPDGYALDLEADTPHPTSMSRAQARDFIARVQSSGRRIGLYDNDAGYPDLGQDWDWIAKWGDSPPARHWDFWQNGQHANGVRQDVFNGDKAALLELLGMQPLLIQSTDLHNLTVPVGAKVYDLAGTLRKTTTAAADQFSAQLVTIGSGGANYWVVSMPGDGGRQLSLIKLHDVTDHGLVAVGGTDPAALAAATAAGFADAKSKAIAAVEGI